MCPLLSTERLGSAGEVESPGFIAPLSSNSITGRPKPTGEQTQTPPFPPLPHLSSGIQATRALWRYCTALLLVSGLASPLTLSLLVTSGNDRKRLCLHRREFHRHLGQQASQPKANSSAVASLPARRDAIALFTRSSSALSPSCLSLTVSGSTSLWTWRAPALPSLHHSRFHPHLHSTPHLTSPRDHMLINNATPRCRRLSSL